METIATLAAKFEAQGGDQVVATIDKISTTGGKAEAQLKKTADAAKGMGSAMQAANPALAMEAKLAEELSMGMGAANRALQQVSAQARANSDAMMALGKVTAATAAASQDIALAQANVNRVMALTAGTHKAAGAAAKGHSFELMNLSRQFADVGVTAALGMNPLLIAIQQGPQIADAFGLMRAKGISLSAAMKELAVSTWAAVAPFAPLIAAGAAVAGTVAAINYLGKEQAETAKAADALGAAVIGAEAAITGARLSIDTAASSLAKTHETSLAAAFGIKTFGGEVGDTAKKLYDLAAAAKLASINSLMARRAALGEKVADLESRTSDARVAGWQSGTVGILPMASAFLGNALSGGARDSQLEREIKSATREMDRLKDATKDLMKSDMGVWADEGRAAMGKVEESAKKAKKEIGDLASYISYFARDGADEIQRVVDAMNRLEKATPGRLYAPISPNYASELAKLSGGATAAAALPKVYEVDRQRLAQNIQYAFADGVQAAFEGNLKGFMKSALRDIASDGFEKAFKGVGDTLSKSLSKIPGLSGLGGGLLGGVVGIGASLLGGLLGSNERKRQERRQAEDDAAQKALDAARTAADQARSIEIQFLRATGQEVKATALQRQAELASLSEANRARQQELYAFSDQIEALNKVTDARLAEVDAATAQLDAASQAVADAQRALKQAYDAEVSRLNSVADAARSMSSGLGSLLQTLRTGSLALNSPGRQYALTSSRFSTVASLAEQGNAAAAGQLDHAANEFLAASRSTAKDAFAYQRDLARVTTAVEQAKAAADSQVSDAQKQLDALTKQVDGIITVNDSVLLVVDAIAALNQAQAAQNAAQLAVAQATLALTAAKNDVTTAQATAAAAAGPVAPTHEAVGLAGYVSRNPDLLAAFNAQTGLARGRTMEEFAAIHWQMSGSKENRYFTPFATGGSFTVGGTSWSGDKNLVQFRANAGEVVNVSRRDNMAAVVEELRRLNARMERLEAAGIQTAINTGDGSKILRRWDGDGMPDVSDRAFAA